jgi:hypothetical protein
MIEFILVIDTELKNYANYQLEKSMMLTINSND